MISALPTTTPTTTATPITGTPSTSTWVLLLGALSGLLLIGHQLPPTIQSPQAAHRSPELGQRLAPAAQPASTPVVRQYATTSAASAQLAL